MSHDSASVSLVDRAATAAASDESTVTAADPGLVEPCEQPPDRLGARAAAVLRHAEVERARRRHVRLRRAEQRGSAVVIALGDGQLEAGASPPFG